jgi:uncharacterized protein
LEYRLDLPVFRYHPDPIASGSICISDARCACCGETRGFVYSGPAYCEADLEEALCPWCIADGSAHAKFDASFADPAGFADNMPRETVEEIAYRTPGFSSWQQERWLTCCADAGAFWEPIGYTELRERYPRLEGSLMMHIVHELGISGAAATRFLHALHRDNGPTAYVFGCRHCDAQMVYIDYV